MTVHRWIVSLASRVVPRGERTAWRAEWEAELAHRERRRREWGRRGPELVWRSLGAFRDAWSLQLGQWHSTRFFARHWRLTFTAVVSLAAAFAAVLVGLTIGDVLLRRPPGVADPGTLRTIDVQTTETRFGSLSYDEFRYYRDTSKQFTAITAYPYSIAAFPLQTGTASEQVLGAQVADNFFEVLGVRPVRGTLAFPKRAGESAAIVVIAERVWRRLGSPDIGTTLRVNNNPAMLAGVVPASFRGMLYVFEPDVWMSFESTHALYGTPPTALTDRSQRWLHMVGRLSPSATDSDADAELRVLASRLQRTHPDDGRRMPLLSPTTVTPAGDRGWMWQWVGSLIAAVFLMLAVASANVTNLLLGLALARRHEMLVRAAVGAGRRHLILPLIRESVALTAVAGVVGYGMAFAVLVRISMFRPSLGPFFPTMSIDVRPGLLVTAVAALVMMACGVLIGLGPALKAADAGMSAMLHRTQTERHTPARFRAGLVLIQMAVVTMVLVILAVGVSSVVRMSNASLGFSARHLTFTSVDMRASGYDERTGAPFYQRIREHVGALPGVEAVSLADGAPFGNGWARTPVSVAERPLDPKRAPSIRFSVVDDRYFSTMGIALVAGRAFDSRDTAGAPEAVIVNATMARRLWPGTDPIGRRVRIADDRRVATVIGVAADGKYEDVSEEQGPFMYLALPQHYLANVTAIARTSGAGPTPLAIAQRLHEKEPQTAIGGLALATLDDLLALSMFLPKTVAAVATVVAVITLLLAVSGLYSSAFYSVGQRRQELTIRMMLGAVSGDIYRIALRTMGAAALAGAAVGIALAMMALPVIASMFYGIRPVEPVITIAVAGTGMAIVLITTLVVVRPLTRSTDLTAELRT